MRETGDIGHIEAKVVWGHSGSKHSGTIETLARQLERRRDADIQSKRTGQQYHGLVWAYAHSTTKNGGTQAWEELPALEANLVSCAKKWNLKPLPRRRGNADEGYFREVFVQRLRIWPSLPNYNGRLSLGIFKLT
jgi:hypothetical protein